VDESSLFVFGREPEKRDVCQKEEKALTKKEIYEQKTESLILPIIEKHAFELVDVEYVKEGGTWYLRAYIDKPGGITVDDCEIVNRTLSDLLDEADFIEESYILEVSSPGLGRPLKKERDYERNLEEEIEIRTYRMVNKQKEFHGILKSYDKETITIENENGEEQIFERDNIALIREYFEW